VAITTTSVDVADVVDRVRDTLEDVFEAVARVRDRTVAIAAVRAAGRPLTTADLAGLRPLLHDRLRRHRDLISGVGFIAEPGLLGDAPAWLEWWQTSRDGELRPLLLDLDPHTSAYSDYTHWDWFALPRETGERACAGPYVDYLCSDEYSLTLSAPVHHGGRFLGVAAADVYLRHFEAAVIPLLRLLPGPACLVNARGRVAASTDARHLAGSLLKGPDAPGEVRRWPCGDIPLVLAQLRSA
jgi:hypothetical protein